VLKDPVAKDEFVAKSGTIASAFRKVAPCSGPKDHGLLGDIEQLTEALSRYPWTALADLKGDPQVLRKLEDTEKLLKGLKKALSD
jgi:hypothetical protein